MRTITLKLSEALDSKLTAAARKSGLAKSALVRGLLDQALGNDPSVAAGSCLELAADLAGCAEGPKDLSYHKKHLSGFGR
jgi:hypothetical protein